MARYTPPLQDLGFVLHDMLRAGHTLAGLPRHAEVGAELLDQVAEEAGRYAAERILPLNRVADQAGCAWRDGRVSTPPGFPETYRDFRQLGWPAMCADVRDGGQGLPRLAFSLVGEMLSSASHAFSMYACINHCAAACLRHSADEPLRRAWLPRLASGEVIASMCMTEPQAGSDIGLAATRAVPAPEGGYRLTGAKIFASGAEQDLSENIMHLVLARLPDAPAGSRGLSLFLVPKLLDDGSSNDVHCDGIEHKMGLHGSATCSLRFEGSRGWLVGEPHQGLKAMFPMMNEARLLSGLQALGLSELGLQHALAYARERRQGRRPGDTRPCPIVEHPDVQRMLMAQKAWTEGARAFVHWTALLIDEAEWHPDPATRRDTAAVVGLLTPIIKGFLTENAQQSLSLALQVHGGHGYIAETGIEQLARDARILTIYEGTTGIQAQDLLMRKVLADQGRALGLLLAWMREWLDGRQAGPGMQPYAAPLAGAMTALQSATAMLADQERARPGAALQACSPYLRLAGHTVLAFLWARAAAAAQPEAARGSAWHQAKLATARFYMTQLLPERHQLSAMLEAPPEYMSQGLAA